jgi:ribose 5-phosphate isomerase B
MTMRIAIAADHNGVDLKARLVRWMSERGHTVDDRGSHSASDVVDYPPLCEDVSRAVVEGRAERGVVIGGSGQGEALACNKITGVRAGLCQDLWSTEISRAHNDSNVLVVPAKIVDADLAEQILATWLDTAFKGGRHQSRIDQIAALERGETLGRG